MNEIHVSSEVPSEVGVLSPDVDDVAAVSTSNTDAEAETAQAQEQQAEMQFDAAGLAARRQEAYARHVLRQTQSALDEAERERDLTSQKLEQAYARQEASQAELEQLALERTRVQEWVRKRQVSYASRLLQRLDVEQQTLLTSIDECKAIIGEPSTIDPRELDGMGRKFLRNFRRSIIIVLAVFLIIVWVKRRWPDFSEMVPVLNWSIPYLALTALVIWILILLRILATYHRNWSQYQAKLDQQAHSVEFAGQMIPHNRREYVRLRDLHPQVEERLALVAESLYRPWVFDPNSQEFVGARPNADALPEMMQLAEVPEGRGDRREEEIKRRAIAEFIIRPRWRSEAYAHLLRCVEEINNRPRGTLTAESVDRSPTALAAVRQSLEDSAAQHLSARLKVSEVALDVQRRIIAEVHPLVASLRNDPLEGLQVGSNLVEEPNSDLADWDEFLVAVSQRGASWSEVVFSLRGRMETQLIDSVKAYAFGPARLQGRADPSVVYTATPDAGTRPLDLLVRIDLSEWCRAEWLTVFSSGAATEAERRVAQAASASGNIRGRLGQDPAGTGSLSSGAPDKVETKEGPVV